MCRHAHYVELLQDPKIFYNRFTIYVLPIKSDCQQDTIPTPTNPNLHNSKYRFTLLHDYPQ